MVNVALFVYLSAAHMERLTEIIFSYDRAEILTRSTEPSRLAG